MPVGFDIEAELSHILRPRTGDGARLSLIDDHACQPAFAADEGTARFVARLERYLHEKLAVRRMS